MKFLAALVFVNIILLYLGKLQNSKGLLFKPRLKGQCNRDFVSFENLKNNSPVLL